MNQKVSIIIPCKDIDALTLECIDTCRQLDHDNFEIIVLPDDNSKGNAKIIATDWDAYHILQKARLSNIFSLKNHRERRVHREKRFNSAFSVYSVVDILSSFMVRGHAA